VLAAALQGGCAKETVADPAALAEPEVDPARARHQRTYAAFPRIRGMGTDERGAVVTRPDLATGPVLRPLLGSAGTEDAFTTRSTDRGGLGLDLGMGLGMDADIEADRARPTAITAGQAIGERASSRSSWSIVLSVYASTEPVDAVTTALDSLHAMGLSEAYADRRGDTVVIAYGEYPSGDDARAREDLARVRALDFNGVRPFEAALLVPPAIATVAGSRPEFDLATVRARSDGTAEFTLQVAIYTRTDNQPATERDLAEFRRAAEQAVLEYRRQGEEAFYYHTSRASTVTIGLFLREDYDGRQVRADGRVVTGPPIKSPRLAALQARFPYTLVNGQGVSIRTGAAPPNAPRRDNAADRLQPSLIVEVPR
jgi:hypothetical protein